jgi:hypothetical protein
MSTIFVPTLNTNLPVGSQALIFMYHGNSAQPVNDATLDTIEPMFNGDANWQGAGNTIKWFQHANDKSNAQIIMQQTGIRTTLNAMINTYKSANAPPLMKEQIVQFYALLSDLLQFLLATIQKLYYIDGSRQSKPSGMTESECLEYVRPAAEKINSIYVKVMENRFASSLLSKVVQYDIDGIRRENKKALGDFGSGDNGKIPKTKKK